MSESFLEKAKLRPKGNFYEEFELGQVFEHHWGRTLNASDNSLFSTLTIQANPLYFNAEFAKAHGHEGVVLNPMMVFGTVFGLSVEDLSEAGGAFLGVDELSFEGDVYPEDTLTARSEVINKRESEKNPDTGIVTWHTQGFNQHGTKVIDFKRTNMVSKKGAGIL